MHILISIYIVSVLVCIMEMMINNDRYFDLFGLERTTYGRPNYHWDMIISFIPLINSVVLFGIVVAVVLFPSSSVKGNLVELRDGIRQRILEELDK